MLSYEIFLASGIDPAAEPPPSEYPTQGEMEYFYKQLEKTLDSREFLVDPSRAVTLAKIRRLFGRSRPRIGELKMLHTLVKLMGREGD